MFLMGRIFSYKVELVPPERMVGKSVGLINHPLNTEVLLDPQDKQIQFKTFDDND